MAPRPVEIDALYRAEHAHLTEEDVCIAIYPDYRAGKGWSGGEANSVISNLKKPMGKKGTLEWRHKEKAIASVAAIMNAGFQDALAKDAIVVPIPPTLPIGDPEYDPRMSEIAARACVGTKARHVELLTRSTKRKPKHLGGSRPSIQALAKELTVHDELLDGHPKRVFLIDDLLTSGAEFKAAKQVLQEAYPLLEDKNIIGLFVARRTLAETSDEDG